MQPLITTAVNQPRFILMRYIISRLMVFSFFFSFGKGSSQCKFFKAQGLVIGWKWVFVLYLLTLLLLIPACSKVRAILRTQNKQIHSEHPELKMHPERAGHKFSDSFSFCIIHHHNVHTRVMSHQEIYHW